MSKIEIIIQNVPANVPVKITINVMEKLYSEVKLYKTTDENGNAIIIPGKPWYIYYYFKSPVTGKMVKFQDSHKINRYKTVKERTLYGEAWVKAQTILLQNNYNPFTPQGIPIIEEQFNKTYTVRTALDYALKNKSPELKESSQSDYKTRIGVFISWCTDNKIIDLNIRDLKDIHIIAFMNYLMLPKPEGRGVGLTSQDNYKRALSAVFAKLSKDKIISGNIVEYQTTKSDPIKNTPFTFEETQKIKEYLLQNDVYLYHYLLFVIYAFLREREIVRLRISNINLNAGTLSVETKTNKKNSGTKTKKLINPVIQYLESLNLEKQKKEAHLFTNTGEFFEWEVLEKSKVDYFTDRFKKVKEKFGFGKEYGIYSFRHTAALNLYKTFTTVEGLTHSEAVSKLMPIIGHSNNKTTEIYLRDIGALLPKDYSSYYTLDF